MHDEHEVHHHFIVPSDIGYLVIKQWVGVDHMYGTPGVETELQELIGSYPTMEEALAVHDEVCEGDDDCLMVFE
jgi:hypothetical protein